MQTQYLSLRNWFGLGSVKIRANEIKPSWQEGCGNILNFIIDMIMFTFYRVNLFSHSGCFLEIELAHFTRAFNKINAIIGFLSKQISINE